MGQDVLCRLWRDDGGQDLAEYALLLALLAVVIVPTLTLFSGTIADLFHHSDECLKPSLTGVTPADGAVSYGQCKKGG